MDKSPVVIVTGAGSGIGAALAAGFARDGFRVVAFARRVSQERSDKHAAGEPMQIQGDVSKRADVDRLFADVMATHGRVDVLINNAAVYPRDPFVGSDFSRWDYAVATNVTGLAYCCHVALPGMLSRGYGRILNVGSFCWRGPIPNSSAYSATKAAVTVLTRAMALEIDRAAHPNVLVNEFVPGVYRTGMSDHGDPPEAAYPHARALVELPAGGPHGAVFLRSELYREQGGLLSRIKRRLLGR